MTRFKTAIPREESDPCSYLPVEQKDSPHLRGLNYKGVLQIKQTDPDGVWSLLGSLSRSLQPTMVSGFGIREIRGFFFYHLTLVFLSKAWGNTFMVQKRHKQITKRCFNMLMFADMREIRKC